MATIPKSNSNPCFCGFDCPCNTRPYRQYRITISGAIGGGYQEGKLYRHEGPVDGPTCLWSPVEPGFPSEVEQLIKFPGCNTAFDHSWEFQLTLRNVPIQEIFLSQCFNWDDPDDCDLTIVAASCENQSYGLVRVGIPPVLGNLVALPEWICTEDQARNWPKVPTPI